MLNLFNYFDSGVKVYGTYNCNLLMSSVRSMATSYFKHYSYIASVYRRHSFSKINISQGSVAMLLGYSGIVCDRSGANFFENVPLKEF